MFRANQSLVLLAGLFLLPACRDRGNGTPALSVTDFSEEPGPDANVVRVTRVNVVDARARIFEFTLSAFGLSDKELFGLAFDVNLASDVGATVLSFTPGSADLIACADGRDGKTDMFTVGVAPKGGPAARLPTDFDIGTFRVQADRTGPIGIALVETDRPQKNSTAGGIGYVADGPLLQVVTGPAVRGGTVNLK